MHKTQIGRIIGWALSLLIAVLLIGPSAMGKFLEWEGKEEAFENLGYSMDVMTKIGVVEVLVAVLFLIPRASFVGAILLTGYLGGAIATHVRVGDAFVMPLVIGVVAWTALGLRNPHVFRIALGAQAKPDADVSRGENHAV